MTAKEKRKQLDEQKDVILVEDYPFFSHYDRIALVDRPYNQQVKPFYRFTNVNEFERLYTLLDLLPLYHKKVKEHLDSVGPNVHMEFKLDKWFLDACESRIVEAHKKYGEDYKYKDNIKEMKYEQMDILNYFILDQIQKELKDKKYET